ncbi:MAG: metal-dependent transcriptional regulator [Chloroflexi bacterium]|nr:metal-dependent transcriptional regulator [Chloroflexota bacterium]
MKNTLTHASEDYLKAIYALSANGAAANTTALAARLGVAPASVTGMLKRLAVTQPPLIVYRKHHGVTLTPAGERAALEIVRHHRLLETYLYRTLGYTWDEVHEEACRLEHVISEDFEERIAEALGHPVRDPHGEPIPTRELTMPPFEAVPLSKLRPGQRAVVQRVHADDPALLRHLQRLGLTPGVGLTVDAYDEFDHNLQIKIDAQADPLVLGTAITDKVFIEVIA